MEKLLEKLGLKADATEDEALAKLEDLNKQKAQLEADKSKLESTNKELTTSVEAQKVKYETLEGAYKSLVESKEEHNDEKSDDIVLEIANLK